MTTFLTVEFLPPTAPPRLVGLFEVFAGGKLRSPACGGLVGPWCLVSDTVVFVLVYGGRALSSDHHFLI